MRIFDILLLDFSFQKYLSKTHKKELFYSCVFLTKKFMLKI